MRRQAFIEAAIHRLSSLPFIIRRHLLRASFLGLRTAGLFRPTPGESARTAGLLKIPTDAARRIRTEAIFFDLLFMLEWAALLNRPVPSLLDEMKHVVVEDDALWRWSAGSRGIVLATLHSGCYQISIAYLCARYFPGRKVVLLRNTGDDPEESAAIDRLDELGIDVVVFRRIDADAYIDLCRLVRNGAVLFMLVDLPGSYGRPAATELFSWQVQIASGVVDIAHLCRAPILFYTVASSPARDVITAHDFAIVRGGLESERARIVEKIARLITREVSERPAQWHLWERFGEFRPAAAAIAA